MNQDNLNILLVEDNPEDQILIKEYLSDGIYGSAQIAVEEKLESALETLQKMAADVVLLDLSLPDSFGLDGLKTMIDEYPDIPVVILTGYNDSATALKAIKMGAQDFLVKGPYDSEKLERIIRYSIERNKLKLKIKESETVLLAKINEIERINKLMIDRELKMAELKKEIKVLRTSV